MRNDPVANQNNEHRKRKQQRAYVTSHASWLDLLEAAVDTGKSVCGTSVLVRRSLTRSSVEGYSGFLGDFAQIVHNGQNQRHAVLTPDSLCFALRVSGD
jgi:hypothetical protein